MKARFLGIGLVAGLLAFPAFASPQTGNDFSVSPHFRPAPGQYPGDRYGDSMLRSFQQRRALDAERRPLTGRHGNNPLPPHIDASGVPDPRI